MFLDRNCRRRSAVIVQNQYNNRSQRPDIPKRSAIMIASDRDCCRRSTVIVQNQYNSRSQRPDFPKTGRHTILVLQFVSPFLPLLASHVSHPLGSPRRRGPRGLTLPPRAFFLMCLSLFPPPLASHVSPLGSPRSCAPRGVALPQ